MASAGHGQAGVPGFVCHDSAACLPSTHAKEGGAFSPGLRSVTPPNSEVPRARSSLVMSLARLQRCRPFAAGMRCEKKARTLQE